MIIKKVVKVGLRGRGKNIGLGSKRGTGIKRGASKENENCKNIEIDLQSNFNLPAVIFPSALIWHHIIQLETFLQYSLTQSVWYSLLKCQVTQAQVFPYFSLLFLNQYLYISRSLTKTLHK
jgi:hypothetical protein